MGKKLALFSDLHSDNRNLSLIADYLRDSNILSGVFLGDAINETMSAYTNIYSSAAERLRGKLRQESALREAVMDGNYTEEQLRMFTNAREHSIATAKRVSKAVYQDTREILYGLEVALLGGNWDHEEEMREVHGDKFLDGDSTEVDGRKVMGLSGGGAPPNTAATTEIMADNDKQDQGYHYRSWVKDPIKFQSDMINARILASHLPVSYGENVKMNGEPTHEVLKDIVTDLKKKGKGKGPKINFHGHTHGIKVKFDGDTGMLLACPGSCSTYHNDGAATFLVAEFSNDDDQLIGFEQYEIYSSLEGLKEIALTGYHTIDWENREIEFEERNETVFLERDIKKFSDHLSLDDNLRLMESGLNVNYTALDPAKDKDIQLRVNLIAMEEELKTIKEDIKGIIKIAGRQYLKGEDGKFVADNLDDAINLVTDELANKAAEALGVNSDLLDNISDPYGRKLVQNALMRTIYGIDGSSVSEQFRDNASKSEDPVSVVSEILAGEGTKLLSNQYQSHILKPLEAQDYQEMAEIYMPANYERKRDIHDRGEGIRLWAQTYGQRGMSPLMTSEQVESSGAYQKIEDYEGKKWTKEELADMFGFDLNDSDDSDDPFNPDDPEGESRIIRPEEVRKDAELNIGGLGKTGDLLLDADMGRTDGGLYMPTTDLSIDPKK
ncbi:MAG: hypothetical protein ABIG93_02850 [archaeon]|nr:hypothetical protein [Nanoarchaeota archaeon]